LDLIHPAVHMIVQWTLLLPSYSTLRSPICVKSLRVPRWWMSVAALEQSAWHWLRYGPAGCRVITAYWLTSLYCWVNLCTEL